MRGKKSGRYVRNDGVWVALVARLKPCPDEKKIVAAEHQYIPRGIADEVDAQLKQQMQSFKAADATTMATGK